MDGRIILKELLVRVQAVRQRGVTVNTIMNIRILDICFAS